MYLSKTKLLTLSLHDFLKYRKKYFFFFIILMLISSCNYKPLFNENRLSNLTFKSIETSGDKRIAQIMVNKLNIIKNNERELIVSYEKNVVTIQEIIDVIKSRKIDIFDVQSRDPDLEDVFIKLIKN